MSDDLKERLDTLWAMLDGDGFYTRAHTVVLAKNRIEELEEHLKAAKNDAMEAEAYAAEMEEKMAEIYFRADRIEELEAERDDYAFKLAEANNTYSEMHVALSEANDKLAKAVEALKDDPWHYGWHQWRDRIIALLAELQGDKT